MSIYSGNNASPFSGGKGKQLAGGSGVKRRKSRAKITRRTAAQSSNAVTRVSAVVISKGTATFGLTNSGQGLIRNANTQALTSNSGLSPYDGLGIIAAGGDPVMHIPVSCGTDFASAEAAFAGKKNIKCTLTIDASADAVEYEGILDPDSKAARNYKIVFPQLTSLLSLSAGVRTELKIEFIT